MNFIFYLFIFLLSFSLFSQNLFTIKGKVIDSIDSKPLPYSTISVSGTRTGAFTNMNGEFQLQLPKGQYSLSTMMTGFQSKITNIEVNQNIDDLVIILSIADYKLEDLIVYAEGPGMRTMRKVIKRKVEQREKLNQYTYSLYTKFVVATDTLTAGRKDYETDTTINSILESYSKSYFQKEDKYFNYILKKRQTENIPPQANFVSFGNNINVYDDYVEILGEKIYSPFNPDAPDYYDFVLEGKYSAEDGTKLSKILVQPKTKQRKLFEGYLIIDSARLLPLEAVLKPNKSVQLPFNAKLLYRQNFNMFDDYFIMPTSLRIFTEVKAEVFWFYRPRLEILLQTYQYDYEFNKEFEDDIFNQRRAEADENADQFDSVFWQNKKIIPLKDSEQYAYDRIKTSIEFPDSIQGTNVFAKTVKPFTDRLRFLNRPPFTGTEDFYSHNRVSGLLLGLGLFSDLGKFNSGKINFAYGFSDQKLNYKLNLNQFFDKYKQWKLSLEIQNSITRSDNPFIVKDRLNRWTSFFGSDAADWYYNESYKLSFEYSWGQRQFVARNTYERPFRISIYSSIENHKTAQNNLIKTIMSPSNTYRLNPQAVEGKYNLLGSEFYLNYNRLRKISNLGLYFNYELSSKELQSHLDYQRYFGEFYFQIRTLPLWKLSVQSTFGYSTGDLPFQKYFALESGPGIITVPGSFRTIRQKEFYGDRFFTLNFEHNFGEIFPGLFRIPSITSFGLEFILMANIAYTDFSQKNKLNNQNSIYQYDFTANTQDKYFYEFGLGLNKLFLFFRFDLALRLSQLEKPRFIVNISGATFR